MTLTELDRQAVRDSFDRAAPEYDRHAVLQHEVESRLLDRFIDMDREAEHILDIGCGTGNASYCLQSRFPASTVIGLDWSQAMLGQMKQRKTNGAEPWPLCADMHRLPLAPGWADLVFSNLAIQWSTDLDRLLLALRAVLKPGGMLLFSTFGPDTLHELRSSWAQADDQPHVNQFPDMHDVGDKVVSAGFVEPVFDVDMMTLEYRDVLDLMRDLKAIGAHNAASARNPGLTGKNKFKRVLESYETFKKGDIYPATYEVVYGVAFGPPEGQPMRHPDGEVATFSVEALMAAKKGGAL